MNHLLGTSTRRRYVIASAALILLGAVGSRCARSSPAAGTAPALLGELRPTVSVKELMKSEIDPVADNIFDAVGTEVSAKGIVETEPKNDADWEKVRVGAVTLAEAANLLKIPRAFAPPGDLNNSIGPNPPELSPTQIQAKLAADPVLWNAKVEALRNVALEVLELVKKKDVGQLSAAGGDLDEACESCHLEYWYPGDKKFLAEYARKTVSFGSAGKPATK